jgi:hypothetical protein
VEERAMAFNIFRYRHMSSLSDGIFVIAPDGTRAGLDTECG